MRRRKQENNSTQSRLLIRRAKQTAVVTFVQVIVTVTVSGVMAVVMSWAKSLG
jgi:hypothetical protein